MFNFFKNNIYHMASMARSGETLLLKILALHENIKIVHNLEKQDDLDKERAFRYLKGYSKTDISRNHKLIRPYNLNRNQILILKQGVWEHQFPFNGFILSRNPVSIYSSLKQYDKNCKWYNSQNNFWVENENRLIRWAKDIDIKMLNSLKGKEPVQQFSIFYNKRMGNLLNTNLPIIRYEDLILNTENTLREICDLLNLKFEVKLLESHIYYSEGIIGHGQNDLSKPIDLSSLEKYKNNITSDEFDFIAKETAIVYKKYGYKIENNEVLL